jgi:hypothetical protein
VKKKYKHMLFPFYEHSPSYTNHIYNEVFRLYSICKKIRVLVHANIEGLQIPSIPAQSDSYVSIRQHTSAYVSIRLCSPK